MDDNRMVFDMSPTGATFVSVEWIQEGAGAFGRDKGVSRAEATAAKVVEIGGTSSGRRTLNIADANTCVAKLEQFVAGCKQAIQEAQQKRAEALSKLTCVCPHCDVTRRYAGQRMLQSGSTVGEVLFGELLTVSNVATDLYVCPTCCSMELFLSGQAKHPLPGTG